MALSPLRKDMRNRVNHLAARPKRTAQDGVLSVGAALEKGTETIHELTAPPHVGRASVALRKARCAPMIAAPELGRRLPWEAQRTNCEPNLSGTRRSQRPYCSAAKTGGLDDPFRLHPVQGRLLDTLHSLLFRGSVA